MRGHRTAPLVAAAVVALAAPPAHADLSFQQTPYPKPGIGPGQPFIADVDGANGPEILVASGGSGKLYSFPNQGGGVFGATTDYAGCGGPAHALSVAEWGTPDSRPDAVIYCFGSIAYLAGNGSGFAAPLQRNVLGSTEVFTTGELDGAGQRELVFSGQQPFMGTHGKPLCSASFNGDAVGSSSCILTPPDSYPNPGPEIETGDLSSSGADEIVTANSANKKQLFVLGGGLDGTRETGYTASSEAGPILIGNVDGDSDRDLIVGDRVGDHYSRFITGPGGLPGTGTVEDTLVQNIDAGLGDFDLDGKPDLVFSNYGSLAIHLGNGNGTFGAGQQFTLPGDGFDRQSRLAVGDVNGDGKADIVVSVASFFGGGAEDKVVVYRNTAGSAPPDGTPPETTIDNGLSAGGTIPQSTVALYFDSSEDGSSFECKLERDGGPAAAYEDCVSPKLYEGLANGPYTFSVRATDGAGNTDPSPATRTFTVDVPPPPPPPPPPPTNPFGSAVGVDTSAQSAGPPTRGVSPPSTNTNTAGGSVPVGSATNPPTSGTTQTVTTGGGPGPKAAAAKRVVIARGETTIPAGKTRKLTAKLTSAGKKLLKRKKTLRVTVTIVARGADGATGTVTKTTKLKLKRPRRR